MQSEELVESFLGNYNLLMERFTKKEMRISKTPDFKVLQEGLLSFYCEVKNSEKDMWLDNLLDQANHFDLVGGGRKDPIYNRLGAHIHKARKQFEAVNSNEDYPNVLAFYNEDKLAGFLDLIAVTSGKFIADDGSEHQIFKQFSEGRLKDDIANIHLFIWLDKNNPHRFLFNTINSKYVDKLSSIFNIDKNSLVLMYS